jgi:D-sedoheptulose 7-phosphate isomerase
MASASSAYLRRLHACLDSLDGLALDRAIGLVRQAWKEGRQVITFGNGGSAITALHFVTDWNKAVHLASGKSFRGRTLVDNMGLLTAYANDLAYEDVFGAQLRNIAVRGDLVIAISGSGNSENVIRGVAVANSMGCQTLGLCGFSGGRLKAVAQHVVWVDVQDMQLCEDVHAIFGHMVMKSLCDPDWLTGDVVEQRVPVEA